MILNFIINNLKMLKVNIINIVFVFVLLCVYSLCKDNTLLLRGRPNINKYSDSVNEYNTEEINMSDFIIPSSNINKLNRNYAYKIKYDYYNPKYSNYGFKDYTMQEGVKLFKKAVQNKNLLDKDNKLVKNNINLKIKSKLLKNTNDKEIFSKSKKHEATFLNY